MSPGHTRSLATFAALGAAATLASGCGNVDHAPGSAATGSAESIVAQRKKPTTQDPCTLLSATEAEAYVGSSLRRRFAPIMTAPPTRPVTPAPIAVPAHTSWLLPEREQDPPRPARL